MGLLYHWLPPKIQQRSHHPLYKRSSWICIVDTLQQIILLAGRYAFMANTWNTHYPSKVYLWCANWEYHPEKKIKPFIWNYSISLQRSGNLIQRWHKNGSQRPGLAEELKKPCCRELLQTSNRHKPGRAATQIGVPWIGSTHGWSFLVFQHISPSQNGQCFWITPNLLDFFLRFFGGITFSCDSPHGSGCEHFLPGSKTSLMGVSHFFSR